MPEGARIRKPLNAPRLPLNSIISSETEHIEDPKSAEAANKSKVPSEGAIRKDANTLDGTTDPNFLARDCMPAQDGCQTGANALGLANGPVLSGAPVTENGDRGEGPSGNKPRRNRQGRDASVLSPEDAAKLRNELEINQGEKAWMNSRLLQLQDRLRAQDQHCQMLVKELRDQKRSLEVRAAKQQVEHEVERKKAQEEAQAIQDAASARIRALESNLRHMIEEQKKCVLEIERNQLIQADLERSSRLAQQHSRQERQTRELDVKLWREWGEENEQKLKAYEEKSRMRDALISSREKEKVKGFQILRACADVQHRQILVLRESLQRNTNRSITSVPGIDFDPHSLLMIIDNTEKLILSFLELLPSPEGILGFPDLDEITMAYRDSLLADLHIFNDSVRLGNSPSSSSSPIIPRTPDTNADSGTPPCPSTPSSSSNPSDISNQATPIPDNSASVPSSPMQRANRPPPVHTWELPVGVDLLEYHGISPRRSPLQYTWLDHGREMRMRRQARINHQERLAREAAEREKREAGARVLEAQRRAFWEKHDKRRLIEWEKEKQAEKEKAEAESRALEEQYRAIRERDERRRLIEWGENEAKKIEQRAKERQAAEDEEQKRQAAEDEERKRQAAEDEEKKRHGKRTAEQAKFEKLPPCKKRARLSDKEMHDIVNRLPGGFPEEAPEKAPEKAPEPRTRRREPLPPPPPPRIILTEAQLAVARRIGRCRDRRRARQGIGPSKRQRRQLRRQQKQRDLQAWEQSSGWPYVISPRFRPRAEKAPRTENAPREQEARPRESCPNVTSEANNRTHPRSDMTGEANGRNHPRSFTRSLRAAPCVMVCTLTIMAAAYAIACWRLWLYEQEYLNANDVPPHMQDLIRAESQSWEWMRILEYELLKGRDRSRLG